MASPSSPSSKRPNRNVIETQHGHVNGDAPRPARIEMELQTFMIGALTLVSASIGACGPRPSASHGAPGECGACHASDYEPAPLIAGHRSRAGEARCGDCHANTQWSPALSGAHPDQRFPLAAPHDYACMDCHDLSSGRASA